MIYLPENALTPIDARSLVAGNVALDLKHRHWILVGQQPTARPTYLCMTGDQAGHLYQLEDLDDQTVLRVSDARLELDPSSAQAGRYLTMPPTGAFRLNDICGMLGTRPTSPFQQAGTPYSLDGNYIQIGAGDHVAIFTRWRMVAGDVRNPFVVCEGKPTSG